MAVLSRLYRLALALAPCSVSLKSQFLRLWKCFHTRKAWLFSGSPRGAQASASLYTLIETAKANQLEPWAYLNHLFEHLPKVISELALQAVLPQNVTANDLKG